VVAVTNQARGLTILEAIVGQLYLVIMVARLAGLLAQKLPHN
jgi:23S rRNA maturation mini-RNase III